MTPEQLQALAKQLADELREVRGQFLDGTQVGWAERMQKSVDDVLAAYDASQEVKP